MPQRLRDNRLEPTELLISTSCRSPFSMPSSVSKWTLSLRSLRAGWVSRCQVKIDFSATGYAHIDHIARWIYTTILIVGVLSVSTRHSLEDSQSLTPDTRIQQSFSLLLHVIHLLSAQIVTMQEVLAEFEAASSVGKLNVSTTWQT